MISFQIPATNDLLAGVLIVLSVNPFLLMRGCYWKRDSNIEPIIYEIRFY
jgi:hypothetical protein